MDTREKQLLNDYQRVFPLTPRPFREVGNALGVSESTVISMLNRLITNGKVSRVGATFVPGRVGATMLGALSVPDARLLEVAEIVNAYPEINHNYEREHAFNLWFVATSESEREVEGVMREIQRVAGCGPALFLPAVESYHVDLGFDLAASPGEERVRQHPEALAPIELSTAERSLVAVLQDGLPLRPAPYAELARSTGMTEADVIHWIGRSLRQRLLDRFGVIVNHRELGYQANAMVVWDVPSPQIPDIGRRVAALDFVTLCQRRLRRHLPYWRYNLYCLIHGKDRGEVMRYVARLRSECRLARYPEQVLFSRQCFRQRGARYLKSQSPRPRELATKSFADRLLSRFMPAGMRPFSPKRS